MVPARASAPHFVGGGRIEFHDRPVPEVGPGQMLLAVRANAVCSSDRRQFVEGSVVTPGHEVAGVVAATGPETSTAIGTPGVAFLMDFCGTCRSCRADATNQCLEKRGDLGFTRDGGYGPYALVSESAFFAIDPALPPAEATLLLDVMGTSRHALERGQLLVSDVERLLVIGAGPVGLGVLVMARLLLGDDVAVLVCDLAPYRLDLVERLGGTAVDVRDRSPRDALRHHGLGPADLAIDASGSSGGRASALEALGQRGALVCVGHGGTLTVDISAKLIAPERAILGSEYFPYAMLADNHRLMLEHRELVAQLITHRVGVHELSDAMREFFEGRTGKVVVEQQAA